MSALYSSLFQGEMPSEHTVNSYTDTHPLWPHVVKGLSTHTDLSKVTLRETFSPAQLITSASQVHPDYINGPVYTLYLLADKTHKGYALHFDYEMFHKVPPTQEQLQRTILKLVRSVRSQIVSHKRKAN